MSLLVIKQVLRKNEPKPVCSGASFWKKHGILFSAPRSFVCSPCRCFTGAWAAYAERAVSFEQALISGAMLFGFLFGTAWCRRQGGFAVHGTRRQILLRYLSGMTGVFSIRVLG
jgi:hypothetical protein